MSYLLAAAHGASEGFWAEYVHLVTDKAHIAFEMTYEIASGIVIWVLATRRGKRKGVREHDAKFHADDQHEEV